MYSFCSLLYPQGYKVPENLSVATVNTQEVFICEQIKFNLNELNNE